MKNECKLDLHKEIEKAKREAKVNLLVTILAFSLIILSTLYV